MADACIKDLKFGKQPYKYLDVDRIAKYGKGFSNLIQLGTSSRHDRSSHVRTARVPHEESLFSPDSEDHNRDIPDELLESGSKFALYRPEIKETPGPLTFK